MTEDRPREPQHLERFLEDSVTHSDSLSYVHKGKRTVRRWPLIAVVVGLIAIPPFVTEFLPPAEWPPMAKVALGWAFGIGAAVVGYYAIFEREFEHRA